MVDSDQLLTLMIIVCDESIEKSQYIGTKMTKFSNKCDFHDLISFLTSFSAIVRWMCVSWLFKLIKAVSFLKNYFSNPLWSTWLCAVRLTELPISPLWSNFIRLWLLLIISSPPHLFHSISRIFFFFISDCGPYEIWSKGKLHCLSKHNSTFNSIKLTLISSSQDNNFFKQICLLLLAPSTFQSISHFPPSPWQS